MASPYPPQVMGHSAFFYRHPLEKRITEDSVRFGCLIQLTDSFAPGFFIYQLPGKRLPFNTFNNATPFPDPVSCIKLLYLPGMNPIIPRFFDYLCKSTVLLPQAVTLLRRQRIYVFFPPGTPADMPLPESTHQGSRGIIVFRPQFTLVTIAHDFSSCPPPA